MSKETSKMGIWVLVDALLLLAIVVIVAFVIGQTKLNNAGRVSPTAAPTDTPAKTADKPETPTPTSTKTPDTPTPTETTEPTGEPTPVPTDPATPTPTNTPTLTPTPVVIKANATVSAGIVNIRIGPGTDNEKATVSINGKSENVQLKKDDRVQILDAKKDKDGNGWYHVYVIYQGQKVEGYAFQSYIKPDAGSGF